MSPHRPAGRRDSFDPARRRLMLAIGSVPLLSLAGCAASGMILHDHRLVGQIYDLRAGRVIGERDALDRLLSADAVLLGETHDNPSHHRLQLGLLQALARERRPVLAMEQFDSEHRAALVAAQGQPDTDAEALADAGRLSREGWGWPLYRPLVEEAVARGLLVEAINLSRDGARAVARTGFAALPDMVARDVVEQVWNERRDAILARLITVGHCNQITPEILTMVVRAQRGRDATMAASIAPHLGAGVVAILGRGHARTDVAVPIYLQALSRSAKVASIGLIEVDESASDPAQYEEIADGAFDLAWFTPRFVRPDPCAALTAGTMKRAMSK